MKLVRVDGVVSNHQLNHLSVASPNWRSASSTLRSKTTAG